MPSAHICFSGRIFDNGLGPWTWVPGPGTRSRPGHRVIAESTVAHMREILFPPGGPTPPLRPGHRQSFSLACRGQAAIFIAFAKYFLVSWPRDL